MPAEAQGGGDRPADADAGGCRSEDSTVTRLVLCAGGFEVRASCPQLPPHSRRHLFQESKYC